MTDNKIRCGNHSGTPTYHASVAEVRACYGAEIIDRINDKFAKSAATDSGTRLSDVPAERRERVLAGLARSAGITDAEREAARGMWDETAADDDERGELHRNRFAATTPVPAPRPVGDATEKQISYVRSLLQGRQAPNADFQAWADVIASAVEAGMLMKRDASRAIERMNAWTKVARSYTEDSSGQFTTDPVGTLATQDGIYRDPATGQIFKGQWNRASGDGRALYFKRLVIETDAGLVTDIPLKGEKPTGQFDWVYVGSAGRAKVAAAWRVSRAEAEQFGRLYGVCIRCHRTLTLEESIDRAMGATCAGKMGW